MLGARTAPTVRLPALQSQSQPEEEDEAEEDEAEELGHTEVYADYVPSKCECHLAPALRAEGAPGRRPHSPTRPPGPWSSADGRGGAVRSPWSGCNRTAHRPELDSGDGK